MNRTPVDNFSAYCQGCKQWAVLRRVDSWRYRCNNCIASEALAACEPYPPPTDCTSKGKP